MGKYKKEMRTWRVTMEHRAGLQMKAYTVVARSGYAAQHVARGVMWDEYRTIKSKGKGWHPRYWSMVGLMRLT